MKCQQVINHQKYPIDERGNPAREQVIEQVRGDLANDGC